MPIKIAICDDRVEDRRVLSEALSDYDPLFKITIFTSGRMLMEEILENRFAAELLFLDIYMPDMDGILTAKCIRNKIKDVKIVFYSSSKEHYPQAYEVFAFNYIEKPLNRERLYSVLDRAFEELRKDKEYKISIQYKGTVQTIDYRDIFYIESNNKMLFSI